MNRQVFFYRTAAGDEPVRNWLMALPEGNRIDTAIAIKTLQIQWPPPFLIYRERLHKLDVYEQYYEMDTFGTITSRMLFKIEPKNQPTAIFLLAGFTQYEGKGIFQDELAAARTAIRKYQELHELCGTPFAGSSFDSFLQELGILGSVEATAARDIELWGKR